VAENKPALLECSGEGLGHFFRRVGVCSLLFNVFISVIVLIWRSLANLLGIAELLAISMGDLARESFFCWVFFLAGWASHTTDVYALR
jgi:hypothetical protein